MTTYRFTPHVTSTVISTVADGTASSVVLGRAGFTSGQTLSSNDLEVLRGCAAAMPNEPLFNQLQTLINEYGSIVITWS